MSRYSLANHPMLLGFDEIDMMIEQAAKMGKDGYPPYNIVQSAPDRFRITLAVAGFGKNDLAITLQARELVIRGLNQQTDDDGAIYLHRGIATRQFSRSFILADGVEIANAVLETGLLHIDLSRQKPTKIVKKIEITEM